jgi:hypothetical protein
VERTTGEVSGRGLVFQRAKTEAGARVVMLPDRVWAELGGLAEFVPDDAEALLFAAERVRRRASGLELDADLAPRPRWQPAFRIFASTTSAISPAY